MVWLKRYLRRHDHEGVANMVFGNDHPDYPYRDEPLYPVTYIASELNNRQWQKLRGA